MLCSAVFEGVLLVEEQIPDRRRPCRFSRDKTRPQVSSSLMERRGIKSVCQGANIEDLYAVLKADGIEAGVRQIVKPACSTEDFALGVEVSRCLRNKRNEAFTGTDIVFKSISSTPEEPKREKRLRLERGKRRSTVLI